MSDQGEPEAQQQPANVIDLGSHRLAGVRALGEASLREDLKGHPWVAVVWLEDGSLRAYYSGVDSELLKSTLPILEQLHVEDGST